MRVRIRGAIWKKEGKRKYQGNYRKYRGKRKFALLPIEGKGAILYFASPIAALKDGWVMTRETRETSK